MVKTTEEQKKEKDYIREILESTSYVLYEMEDIAVQPNPKDKKYIKYKNPLFYKEILDNKDNREILKILSNDIPFYFLDDDYVIDSTVGNEYVLQMTRDSSKTDVPSYLQTDFWSVWFNDAWGGIQNSIILDAYNMLKYPMMNENQYLNTDIFSKLSDNLYSIDNSLHIDFMDTEQDYREDTYFKTHPKEYHINYVERINSIIDQKLTGIYEMLNYKPDYFQYLSDLCESLINSGTLSSLSVSKEKSVYKLQDIQYELLRRKFAGSSTLYDIALASIGRQGGLNRTIELGKLRSSSTDDKIFRDKRKIKILNLPGILTENNFDDYKFDPLTKMSLEYDNTSGLPMDIVASLYYTSGIQGLATEGTQTVFKSNDFYDKDKNEYRRKFLRDISSIIDWDELGYVSDVITATNFYFALDEKTLVIDPTSPSGFRYEPRQLDGYASYTDQLGQAQTTKIRLDVKIPSFDRSNISGVMFDISANKILYHENILQKTYKSGYQYVTYPISDGKSLSLMDNSVVDYMKVSTEKKSRVQDRVDFGTQISYYADVNHIPEVEDNIFAIGYQKTADGKVFDKYSPDMKFAILYYVCIKYNIVQKNDQDEDDFDNPDSFRVTSVSKIPITKITLNHYDDAISNDINDFIKNNCQSRDIYPRLIDGNIGVLPLTYSEYRDYVVTGKEFVDSKNPDIAFDFDSILKLGVIEHNGELYCYDDANDYGYTVANFIFGKSEYASNINIGNVSPKIAIDYNTNPNSIYRQYYLAKNESLSWTPVDSEEGCGVLYYSVCRSSDTDNVLTGNHKYNWSDPIFYISVGDIPKIGDRYYPEWLSMKMQINPYLNVTRKSASPMRYMENNIPMYILCDSDSKNNAEIHKYVQNDEGSYIYVNEHREIINEDGSVEYVNDMDNYPPGTMFFIRNPQYNVDWENIHNIASSIRDGDINLDFAYKHTVFDHLKRYDDSKDFNTLYYKTSGEFIYYVPETDHVKEVNATNIKVKSDSEIDETSIYCDISNIDTSDTLYLYTELDEHYEQVAVNIYIYENTMAFPAIGSSNVIYYDFTGKKYYLWQKQNDDTYMYVENRYYGKYFIENAIVNGSLPEKDAVKQNTYYIVISTRNVTINNEEVTAYSYRCFEWVSKGLYKINPERLLYDIVDDSSLNKCIYLKEGTKPILETAYMDTYKLIYATYRKVKYDNANNSVITYDCHTIKYQSTLNDQNEVQESAFTKFLTDASLNKNGIYLYDLRVYNDNYVADQKNLINGSIRYQYSCSPSVFKLAYSLYRDLGIFKNVSSQKGLNISGDPTAPNRVTGIRLFSRSVWDTIYVDRYPIDEYEEGYNINPLDQIVFCDRDVYSQLNNICYINDAINQNLTDSVEVNNSIGKINNKSESLSLVYKGHTYKITDESLLTIVNTTLYPIYYRKEPFASDGSISVVGEKKENDVLFKVKLPVDASKDTLKYYTDVNVNMVSKVMSDLSNPINCGDNVEIVYDQTNGCPVCTLKDISIKSDASKNYIMVPLKMAKISSKTSSNYLDKFYLSNFKLSNAFTKMLYAKAYYNEFKIPIAVTDDGKPSYIYKYDAIRLYKEGTYYLTVKYPMMILPMFDYDFVNSNYPIVYGSMRFKIEVRGKAVENSTYKVESDFTDTRYSHWMIDDTLRNTSKMFKPVDNRIFPHREIDIKLYAMTNDGIAGEIDSSSNDKYSYSWDLIASNNRDDLTDDVMFIDNEAADSGIFIRKKVSLYMSRNYTMPFFLAHQKKQSDGGDLEFIYDATEADDDLIDPIEVGNVSTANLDSERLFLREAKDIDSINLYSFKDYSLVFDNTSKLVEYTYTNNYYDNMYSSSNVTFREGFDGDLNDERNNYSRLSNVLDRSMASDYMYTEQLEYTGLDNVAGYKVENDNWIIGVNSNQETCFGNPYSSIGAENSLYGTHDRNVVSSAYNIQYVIENYGENDAIAYRYSNFINEKIDTWSFLPGNGRKFKNKSLWTIDESRVLSSLYDTLYTIFDLSSSEYMVSELSKIEPHFICRDNSTTDASVTALETISENLISNSAYDLYSYARNPYKVMTSYDSDRFTISRNGLYNNNLIDSAYYTNDYWYGTLNTGTWERDDIYGKDVYEVDLDNFISHTGSETTNYILDSNGEYVVSNTESDSTEMYESNNTVRFVRGDVSYSGNYEIAINVKDIANSTELIESVYAYLVEDDERVSSPIRLNRSNSKAIYNYIQLTEDSTYDPEEIYFIKHNIYFEADKSNIDSEKSYYVNSGQEFVPYVGDITADIVLYDIKEDYIQSNVIIDSTNFIESISKGLYVRQQVDSWAVYSNEVYLTDTYANGIEFIICPKTSNCKVRLGKPIVRLAVTDKSHVLGLSNITVSDIVRDNKLVIPAAYLIFYKSKINDLVVTCQLKSYISNDRVMFRDATDFILNGDITPQNFDTKMRKILEPWTRNLVYTECDNDGNRNIIKEYSYRVSYDSFGKKTISTTELGTHLYDGSYVKFSPDREYINLYVHADDTSRTSVYSEIESTFDIFVNREFPLSVENEMFSALTDCFNPLAIMEGKDSNIAITNIQFLSEVIDEKGKDIDYVLYELEYLPIVYNEKNYHFSINFMLNQNRVSLIE